MKLITKSIERTISKIYSQDGKGYDALAHVRLFNPAGDGTWYVTEYDPAEQLAFGLTFMLHMTDQLPKGELGYFSIAELQQYRGLFHLGIERDLSFTPATLTECLRRYHGVGTRH